MTSRIRVCGIVSTKTMRRKCGQRGFVRAISTRPWPGNICAGTIPARTSTGTFRRSPAPTAFPAGSSVSRVAASSRVSAPRRSRTSLVRSGSAPLRSATRAAVWTPPSSRMRRSAAASGGLPVGRRTAQRRVTPLEARRERGELRRQLAAWRVWGAEPRRDDLIVAGPTVEDPCAGQRGAPHPGLGPGAVPRNQRRHIVERVVEGSDDIARRISSQEHESAVEEMRPGERVLPMVFRIEQVRERACTVGRRERLREVDGGDTAKGQCRCKHTAVSRGFGRRPTRGLPFRRWRPCGNLRCRISPSPLGGRRHHPFDAGEAASLGLRVGGPGRVVGHDNLVGTSRQDRIWRAVPEDVRRACVTTRGRDLPRTALPAVLILQADPTAARATPAVPVIGLDESDQARRIELEQDGPRRPVAHGGRVGGIEEHLCIGSHPRASLNRHDGQQGQHCGQHQTERDRVSPDRGRPILSFSSTERYITGSWSNWPRVTWIVSRRGPSGWRAPPQRARKRRSPEGGWRLPGQRRLPGSK